MLSKEMNQKARRWRKERGGSVILPTITMKKDDIVKKSLHFIPIKWKRGIEE